MFLDTDLADSALDSHHTLAVDIPHAALTNRAFESTQVAKMRNIPLRPDELEGYEEWKKSEGPEVSDRSVRLLMGLR
jgi:hypothetical protein